MTTTIGEMGIIIIIRSKNETDSKSKNHVVNKSHLVYLQEMYKAHFAAGMGGGFKVQECGSHYGRWTLTTRFDRVLVQDHCHC